MKVTAITSIIEGQIGRPENREQKQVTIQREVELIKNFFRLAQAFDEYFVSTPLNLERAANLLSGDLEKKLTDYVSVIKVAQQYLYQKKSEKNANDYLKMFLELLKKHEIAFSHPVAVCCIAVLYGSDDGQKVLKATGKISAMGAEITAHNALADILAVTRVQNIRALCKSTQHNIEVEYFTFDEGLSRFVKWFSSATLTHLPIGVSVRYRPTKELFPKMSLETFNSTYPPLD